MVEEGAKQVSLESEFVGIYEFGSENEWLKLRRERVAKEEGGIAWNCRIACSVSFVRSTCLQLKWSLQMSSSGSAMPFEKNTGAGLVTAHHHLPREGCQKRKEKDWWLLLHSKNHSDKDTQSQLSPSV